MTDDPNLEELSEKGLLLRIARELKTIRENTNKAIFAIHEAESEIPEKMRRFMNYAHDLHSIKFLYEEHGQPAPDHINHELRRIDDRCRQLLDEMHEAGGPFERVRQKMANDPANRWDHTRLLSQRKEGA